MFAFQAIPLLYYVLSGQLHYNYFQNKCFFWQCANCPGSFSLTYTLNQWEWSGEKRVVIFSSYSGDQSSSLHVGQSRAFLPSTNHVIFSLDQSRALLSQPITCSPQPTNHVLSSPTTTATWKLDLVNGKGSNKNVQNVSWIKNRLIDEWNRGRSRRGYRFDNQHIKNKIIAGCWSYILSFTPTATVIKEANCTVYTFWYGFGFGFYAIWSKHSIFAMSESSLIFRKTKINVRQQMKTNPFSPSLLGPSQDVNCLPLYDVWDKQLILF